MMFALVMLMALVTAVATVYGVSQGWFFAAPDPPPVPPVPPPSQIDIVKLKARIIELEGLMGAGRAKISDDTVKAGKLMNDVNRLTLELEVCRNANTQFQAAVKGLTEDLDATRKKLSKCAAEKLARNVGGRACRMAPEFNDLLR